MAKKSSEMEMLKVLNQLGVNLEACVDDSRFNFNILLDEVVKKGILSEEESKVLVASM